MYMKTLGLDNLSGYQITMSHFVLEQLHASLQGYSKRNCSLHRDFTREYPWMDNYEEGASSPGASLLKCLRSLSSGQEMFSFDADEMKDSSSISRWLLRNALLHKSGRFVNFGETFQRYEKLKNGTVNIYFDDGSVNDFDLFIGAGDVGSKVRINSSRIRRSMLQSHISRFH